MPLIFLREEDVQQLVTMPEVIMVMEEAFRQLAEGQADNVPRRRASAPGIVLHSMSAAAGWLGVVGWKQYTTTRSGARFHVGLYDQATGQWIALLEANRLGQQRTGAVTGVATKYLARPDADRVGLIGAGWQAESQLEAVAAVRPLRRVHVYCRDAARRRAFAATMSQRLGLEVIPADSAQEALRDMPIVVTATSSRVPVIEASWLAEDVLVAAVGSNWLDKAELDVDTFRRADRVVCDRIDCCQLEAGDFVAPLRAQAFRWETAVELAEICAGRVPGRTDPGCVIFKSVGLALEDVALAHYVVRRACEARTIGLTTEARR